jgi:glutathione S-transferase
MPLVYGPAASPFVRKVCIFLHEKGIPYERRELDPEQKTPEFLALNPAGRVPVFEEDDGHVVSDSSVICDYLERTCPEPSLYPKDARDRARALWLEEYADTALVAVTARVFWMHVILPIRTGTPLDPAAVREFVERAFPAAFGPLEALAPEGEAFVGERFGIADIALAAPVRLLDLVGAGLDTARWPRFSAYVGRVLARPSATRLFASERIATESYRTTGAPPAAR